MGGRALKVAVDTNLIIRVLIEDDDAQAEAARTILKTAEAVYFPIAMLCEAIWVLRRSYRLPSAVIIRQISTLLADPRAETDWPAYDIGMALFAAGGDFADGAIASQGLRLGADTFATFDQDAAALLRDRGVPVTLLG